MKYFKIIYFTFLFFPYLLTAQTKKALVILMDGIPMDVIEKVNTPTLDAISKKGGFYAAYVGGEKEGISQSPTISAVGYNSMLTGTWANKHNVWDNSIKNPNYQYPTFFKIINEQKPEWKLGIFSTWQDNRTKLLGENLPQTGKLQLNFSFDGYELDTLKFPHDKASIYIKNIDKLVSQKASETIAQHAPELSWVYLQYTDDAGHKYGDSDKFYEAISYTDSLVNTIYKQIIKREKENKEEWLVLITTDHGRDAQTGKNHGGQSDRERATWIVSNKKLASKGGTMAIVDILPTITDFFEIDIPNQYQLQLDGTSILKKNQ
jgi:predicted AlkP superfamily pyrophosphatase or phosphodiesterase